MSNPLNYTALMKTVRYKLEHGNAKLVSAARIDLRRVDATTEKDIARQKNEDNAEAMHDAAQLVQPKRCSK